MAKSKPTTTTTATATRTPAPQAKPAPAVAGQEYTIEAAIRMAWPDVYAWSARPLVLDAIPACRPILVAAGYTLID